MYELMYITSKSSTSLHYTTIIEISVISAKEAEKKTHLPT